jgi:diaminohydroxyphosphoribosylaminopyrimidine deaminase/5-amino-6-(5-phosphoribosylamino)uracil reductase
MKINHNNYLKLAFNIAKINLGKTSTNPSVGCVVVKDNTVISTGFTSVKGRPHAEFNALSANKDFKNTDLYVTMEPCTHKGFTPPCSKIILKKGIKRVFFSFNDKDKRTANKFKNKFLKTNIKIIKKSVSKFNDFYKSYYLIHENKVPFIDAKIAVSKDFLTINKNSKWITNYLSRNQVHLLRSKYDAIISTSKTMNCDNSLLNCRINGLDNTKPDLFIIDVDFKIKTNLSVFKSSLKRKIYIITSKKNIKKSLFFKKKNIHIIQIRFLENKNDFTNLFNILKKLGYNRILIETGLTFINEMLKNDLIYNLYMFQSAKKLGNNGENNATNILIKSFKLSNRVNVNLKLDNLYKIKIK